MNCMKQVKYHLQLRLKEKCVRDFRKDQKALKQLLNFPGISYKGSEPSALQMSNHIYLIYGRKCPRKVCHKT